MFLFGRPLSTSSLSLSLQLLRRQTCIGVLVTGPSSASSASCGTGGATTCWRRLQISVVPACSSNLDGSVLGAFDVSAGSTEGDSIQDSFEDDDATTSYSNRGELDWEKARAAWQSRAGGGGGAGAPSTRLARDEASNGAPLKQVTWRTMAPVFRATRADRRGNYPSFEDTFAGSGGRYGVPLSSAVSAAVRYWQYEAGSSGTAGAPSSAPPRTGAIWRLHARR